MTAVGAIRFLAHEAKECRDKDSAEALCLLLPALLRALDLPPMEEREARAFRYDFREVVQNDFRFDPKPSTVGCPGWH